MTPPVGAPASVSAMDRPTLWGRIRRVPPWIWDGLLAAALLAIAIPVAFSHVRRPEAAPLWVEVALILTATVPLAFRRRAPVLVLVVVAASNIGFALAGFTDDLTIQLAIATYTAAAHEPRRTVARIGAPVALAAAVVAVWIWPPTMEPTEGAIAVLLSVGMPLAIGRAVFNRRRRLDEDRERAARDAVTEERARIARELHDVVAHAMSVMVVQAGAARTVVERDPAAAADAIRQVEVTGREGLAEMRRLIGVLKATDEEAALAPQPGLGDLDALLGTVRAAGLPVESMVIGDPRDLPPGVDLTAYRVVQEALTNVLRHAGVAHASVTLRYEPDGLEVTVADDGRGPHAGDGGGQGLVGMRERIALFDGSLETGPRAGGGFEVRARIPLAGVPA